MITVVYDGNNTAYRANCVTELYNKAGERVSAILGTLKSIKYDIPAIESETKDKVGEVIVLWDCGKAKRRMELYPEYKGNRRKDQTEDDKLWFEEFLEQANFLHNNLHKFGVKSLKIQGWEADDLAYALKQEANRDIVFVSTDEDWLQMVDEHTSVFSPIKKKYITEDNFEEQLGLPKPAFIHYKALRGDSSDNIAGIYGVGEKIGKKLMLEFGTLPNMLKNGVATLSKSKRLAPILTDEGRRLLFRNLRLMDLTYVDYSSIKEDINDILQMEVHLIEREVLSILKANQFIVILADYKKWLDVYRGLNN